MKTPLTSKERVLSALHFEKTGDTPFSWGFGPNYRCRQILREQFISLGLDWDLLQRNSEDINWVRAPYTGDKVREGQPDYMAIWGIKTRSVHSGEAHYEDEICGSPLAEMESLSEIEAYPWPRASDFAYKSLPSIYTHIDPHLDHAVRIDGGNPFEIYCWMNGMEEALIHLYTEPERLEATMAIITHFFQERTRCMAEAFEGNIDIVQIGDDLGCQTSLLISPEIYRKRIQPFHHQLTSHIREILPHAKIAYHTDGTVFDIIPDLIDAGIDLLEAVQTECDGMDPQRLSSTYGTHLRFQGAISVQQLLPTATPETIKTEITKLIYTLGEHGGYIAAPSHAIQAGTPPANILAMLEAVLGDERYARLLEQSKL